MQKERVRKDMIARIKKISIEKSREEDDKIFDLRQRNLYKKYRTRAVYKSYNDEVDTEKIIRYIYENKGKCLLPIQQENNFVYGEIGPYTKYQKNKQGVYEPTEIIISKDIPDAILVPGVAYTKQGKRLGRGMGRYDRCLAQYPTIIKIGMAYTDQIIEIIPTQAHDQCMDIILSTQLYFKT